MSLQQIVNVNISRETTAIPQAGFGAAMILETHEHENFVGRVNSYSNADAVLTTGFNSASAVYRMASQYFKQDPTPARIFVGRRLEDSTAVATVSGNLDIDHSTTVTVNGNSTDATV
jgi:hypothetical protein